MKSKLALAFIAVVSLGACLDMDPGQADTTATTDVARLASNALMPGQMQTNVLDQSALTSAAIAPYTTNADSRAYLNYLVGCALGTSQGLVSNGFTFTGSLGIVPAWTTRALTLSEARWVSACIIARLNYSGTSVQISMRGSHSSLTLVGTEGADYNTQEGAFYGNVFSPKGFVGYACNGVDQAAHDGYGALALRECANSDPAVPGKTYCNLADKGLCTTACTTTGGSYAGCTGYDEVITTYVYGNPL
jgi:hypothetical protein